MPKRRKTRKAAEKMQRLKLTDSLIKGLPTKDRDYTVWDWQVGGFGVRVYRSGVKSYHTAIGHNGGFDRRTIAITTDMTCAAARKVALERIMATTTAPSKPVPCLKDFIHDVWIPHHNIRTKPATQRRRGDALKHVLPTFGDKKMDAITRTDLTYWFDELSHMPITANKALDLVSQIFNYAIEHDVMARNPARDIRRNKQQKRTRFLSHQEIEHLHKTMDAYIEANPLPLNHMQRDIVRLLLLTGCRRGEVLTLRWDEVKGNILRLQDSKTGPRAVYLNAQAMAIIDRQRLMSPQNNSPFVFPSPVNPDKPIRHIDPFWQFIRAEAGFGDVRLHDLRHSFASHAVMRGVPLPIVSRLLGHSRLSMTMRYAHVSNELVEAAAEKVGSILAGYLDAR